MPQATTLRVCKPLLVAAAVAVVSVVAYAADTPSANIIVLMPLIYCVSALIWPDQLEPEPRAMHFYAVRTRVAKLRSRDHVPVS